MTGFDGLREKQRLRGRVFIEALVCGPEIRRVVFRLEGERLNEPIDFTDETAPYIFDDAQGSASGWDTSPYPDGEYALTATAVDAQGRRGSRHVHFWLDNNQDGET